MGTNINYVDETWNPVCGCTKCSPGCDNCYAEKMAVRLAFMQHTTEKYSKVIGDNMMGAYFWNGEVVCDEKALEIPLHWRKPRRILAPSMGDLFHEKVPFTFIQSVLGIIAVCPQHTFLLLTKRIERAAELSGAYPDNIHLGVTICNQKEADEKIPILLQIPAVHRWLSIEPMLGEIYLPGPLLDHGFGFERNQKPERIGQIVVGCESGSKRRPCKPEWIKDVVRHCSGVIKCFVKQMEVNGKVVHKLSDMPAWAVQEI